MLQNFDPIQYHKMHFAELRQEAQRHRLVQEARKARHPKASPVARALVTFGYNLAVFGANLEKRYSSSLPTEAQVQQQTSMKGCE